MEDSAVNLCSSTLFHCSTYFRKWLSIAKCSVKAITRYYYVSAEFWDHITISFYASHQTSLLLTTAALVFCVPWPFAWRLRPASISGRRPRRPCPRHPPKGPARWPCLPEGIPLGTPLISAAFQRGSVAPEGPESRNVVLLRVVRHSYARTLSLLLRLGVHSVEAE